MAFYAVYDSAGIILKTIECPPFMINQISQIVTDNIVQIDRVANDKTEMIVNKQLVKKPQAAE